MIPANELAALQAAAVPVLDQTVTVQHVTITRGSFGEAQQSFGTSTSVACLIGEPSNEQLQLFGPKIGERFAWKLTVAPGADIRVGDQVTMPNGIVGTVVGPDLVKSYPVLNNFLVVAVR